jgi:hypothetical protein
MAQTTSAINGKATTLSANSQNIAGSSNALEFEIKMLNGEYYTFDGDWRKVLGGKLSFSGTLTIVYSETSGEGMQVLYDAFVNRTPIAFVASPAGGASGAWQFSGNILLTSIPLSFKADDANAIMVGVPFEGDGQLVRATIA